MDDRNREISKTSGPSQPAKRTEGFKLNIDEKQLTGMTPVPQRRKEVRPPYGEQPPMQKKIFYTEKERREEEKAHKKRNKVKSHKNKRVFSIVWLIMVLLVSFTLASYLISGTNDFFAVGRTQAEVEVEIPENVTPEKLAQILFEKGAISKKEFFSIYCKVTADMQYFEPGKFRLNTNLDYEDIINTLQGGGDSRVVQKVTFPEGTNVLQMGNLLEQNKICSKEEFLAALNSDAFDDNDLVKQMGDASGKYYKLEGYLFPDTYEFYEQEEVNSVIGKMLDNFQNRITADLQNDILKSGYSMDQIVTLASIIQWEAADTNDMYMVSAVLRNRLSFGADYGIYGLGCDSTQFYPYKQQSDVPAENPLSFGAYDTYKVEGLPAGAICNPGLDAITAAVRPSTQGDAPYYLYFCHDANGVAYYAQTEEGHLENQYAAGLL